MCENHGNIELQTGGGWSPRLDLVTAEYQLPHLGAHDDAHHALLYEGPRTADVGTVWRDQLTVLAPFCLLLLPVLVDVAVLH